MVSQGTSTAFCPSLHLFCSKTSPLRRTIRSRVTPICAQNTPHSESSSSSTRYSPSRRNFLIYLASFSSASIIQPPSSSIAQQQQQQEEQKSSNSDSNTESEQKPKKDFEVDGGIAYVDFEKGSGPTPKWGDYVTFHYILYTINPKTKDLIMHDKSYGKYRNGFLIHHGNGEQLLGLERMVHTMSIGSKRRFVLPQQLAYYKAGFIPIPESARARKKLSRALNETNGIVVFDIELLDIKNDPDDRGYYTDLTLTDEQFIELLKTVPRVEKKDQIPGAPSFEL